MRRHNDANQIFHLLVAREIAKAILAHPALLDLERAKMEAMATRPHTGAAVACWRALLDAPIATIAATLSRDDADADYVREAMPAFIALDAPTRTRLVVQSRAMFAAERETT